MTDTAHTSAISEQQRHVLRHALGLNRSAIAYRNYFCTGPGTDNYPVCMSLVGLGLMSRRETSGLFGGDSVFHVTPAGLAAVGVS